MADLATRVMGFEGWTPRASWDYKQHSNGFGTRAKFPGEVIDQNEARQRLATELDAAKNSVTSRFPNLAPHQTDALTSFTYNLGPGWMSQPTRLAAAVEAGDHATAAKVMQEYNKAGGKVLPGLASRRSAESAMYLGGDAPASTPQAQSSGATPMAAPALTPYDGPSPDDVAMQRKLAMSLMQQGTSAEPVGHWTQALARVLQGGVGGMYQDTARQGEKQGTQGIVDMLQGQQNPTPVQLLSNPWTREAGMKTLVQSAKGPEYGKQGTIVQDGQGNFYAVQFNDKGETKYHKLQAGGLSPTGVMSSESGMQMNGGQGTAPTALQPSKGTKQIGSTVVDVATGRPISNVEEAIAGKEKAEEVGKVQGKFVGAFPKLEAGLQAWDRQADLTTKIIDRSIQSIEKNGRYVAGVGAPLSMLPETEARKLRNDLETIKANIGFDKLQAMREASPTGGALGAVSDMENRLLQAVQGALDQSGDPKALSDNLANIKQMLGALRLEKKQAFATDVSRFGGAARPQGAPPGAGIPAPPPQRLKFNPATGALE